MGRLQAQVPRCCDAAGVDDRGKAAAISSRHRSRTLLTKVLRISCLLGLFEARTIRFPRSFFIEGVFKAVGRTCFSDIVEVNGKAILRRLPTS